MTVQELIATLQSIDDKTREVKILPPLWSACSSSQIIESVRDTGSGILIYAD